MYVDIPEVDSHLTTLPTGSARTDIEALMEAKGLEALAAQNQQVIARVDISPTSRYKYREDYNIGDLVSVNGNYDTTATMRVVEHIETVDEFGATSTPVLSAYKGD
jgi:hypothetical protein